MGFLIENLGNRGPKLYSLKKVHLVRTTPNVQHWNNPLKGKLKGAINKVTTAKNNAIQTVTTVKNNALVKVKTNVKEKLANLAQSKGFIVLTPYKQVMRAILKKRGHNISNSASIQQVSMLFYDAMIKGKTNFNYANYAKRLRHLSEDATNVAVTGASVGVTAATGGVVPPAVTAGIIKAILAWFKKIKAKKDQGATLSPEEKVANDADEVIEAKGEGVIPDQKGWLARFLDSIFKPRAKESFRRRIDERNRRVSASNKPTNIVAATPATTVRPFNSATELAYANALKPNALQNIMGRGTVMAAGDLVRSTPTGKKYPKNTWILGKDDKWHWSNNQGNLVS